ncbi:hypothetical protein GGI25_006148 [Coemansia spiralis]|uniref:Uncharacterized protein n=2 Tax=Coemansia TaxID=4863 RepID=A0A9W8KVS8_9FUNG|nr:hypothetical protein EDC05_004767 [Coemansia umbellata]KAJ2618911.1 hypothetical protein GGI26_006253 [Coemansia sp. RSA 1358]KAJ2669434.1 hypothetical protein GGI25_006148 [Coemansia spiralis]
MQGELLLQSSCSFVSSTSNGDSLSQNQHYTYPNGISRWGWIKLPIGCDVVHPVEIQAEQTIVKTTVINETLFIFAVGASASRTLLAHMANKLAMYLWLNARHILLITTGSDEPNATVASKMVNDP